MSSSIAFLAATVGGVILIASLFAKPARGTRSEVFSNPDKTPGIAVNDLANHCTLAGPGNFSVQTFRQSGNHHQEAREFSSPEAAIKAAMSTFKRAGVDSIVIVTNSPEELRVRREWLNFRGRNEGKRLGWIEIRRF